MRDQPSRLTTKQENFCLSVAAGKSSADAYRESYSATRMMDKTVQECASRLMADRKVSARLDALRERLLTKVSAEIVYDYRAAMAELDDAIIFAKSAKNAGAFVAACNLKQKISGLHVEDRKNDQTGVGHLNADQVRAALEAITAIRKAKLGA